MSTAEPKSTSRVDTVRATEAQNNFGALLRRVGRGETIFITKYGHVEAVMLSGERYREISGLDEPDLDALTREFDALVARMQSREAAAGFDALFEMSSAELGESAVKAARTTED